MFCSFCVWRDQSLNQEILTIALYHGVVSGQFKKGKPEMRQSVSASSLGLSTWDIHKLSIITDLFLALTITAVCLGLKYGCPSLLSSRVWAITGFSIGGIAWIIDCMGYVLNISRLSKRVKTGILLQTTAYRNEGIKRANQQL